MREKSQKINGVVLQQLLISMLLNILEPNESLYNVLLVLSQLNMQSILITYSCIIIKKDLENDNNRGHNIGSVPHGQYMYVTISVVTGKCVH